MSKLMPIFVEKLNLPDGLYSIYHKNTGKQLTSGQTFMNAGVQTGDTIRLLTNITAGGGLVVNSFRDIQLINAYFNHELVSVYNRFAIYAVILYTASDTNIANFVRENFLELHHLSGHTCAFFVVEKPEDNWL